MTGVNCNLLFVAIIYQPDTSSPGQRAQFKDIELNESKELQVGLIVSNMIQYILPLTANSVF